MKFNKSHFEDYLSERLPASEKNNFEHSLNESEDLRNSFNFYKKFREKNGLVNGTEEASPPTQSNNKKFSALSALYGISLLAAVGFLCFSGVYWHALYNYTDDALQEEFLYEPYDLVALEDGLTIASSSVIHLQEVVLAQQYFKSEEYIDAINFFDQIIENNTKDADLFGTELSMELLEQTEWNRVICMLLMTDSNEEVKNSLDAMISDKTHDYHKSAVALDTKMTSFMRGLVASI